ncbi:MAG: helix-turn-helix domain-containing protein [Acidimicrobiales bacterium]
MPGSSSDEPIVLTIAEAAARLGIHRQTLRAAIERGDLHAVRVGRRWLIPVAAIEELLGDHRAGA